MTTRHRADESDVLKDSPATSSTVSGADLPGASESQQVIASRYGLRVLQALRQIIREVDLYSRQLLRQYEITGPQLITLLTVKDHERVTVSAIAHHIHLSSSTVIGILDRLETKGLVRRDRDLKDRRLVYVSLTEQGEALAKNAPSPLQDAFAGAMRKLPEAELIMITESLERIVGLMQIQHMDSAPILESEPIDPVE